MEKLKDLILRPMTMLQEKADFKKIGILLGCMLGILFIGDIVSYAYAMRDVEIHIHYFEYIKDFLLNQVAFLGSILVGVYALSALTKKKFDIAKACQIVLVSFAAYYLVDAVMSILFMFDFMDIKFLVAIKNALVSAASYFSYFVLVFATQKEFGITNNEKGLWNYGITFFIIFAVRNLLYLLF